MTGGIQIETHASRAAIRHLYAGAPYRHDRVSSLIRMHDRSIELQQKIYCRSGELFEQPGPTMNRVSNTEVLQNRPDAGSDRMNNRHSEIVFRIDDVRNAPSARAQEINSVHLPMRVKSFRDVTVDLFARQVVAPVEIDRN